MWWDCWRTMERRSDMFAVMLVMVFVLLMVESFWPLVFNAILKESTARYVCAGGDIGWCGKPSSRPMINIQE